MYDERTRSHDPSDFPIFKTQNHILGVEETSSSTEPIKPTGLNRFERFDLILNKKFDWSEIKSIYSDMIKFDFILL